ncbi:LuxR C-terminal-related transcriptional regulator [Paraprevotella xylaniphila]|nr:LuxR C-terminal-related transcriptional regulator [Paraprevotella xylaniphila]
MEDIANKLCKSLDTIKSAKRRLFLKMNVSNIQEAVASAEYYDLL